MVDCQRDFLPGGALAVPDGDQVIEPLQAAAEEADLVIASRDWHPKDHASFDVNGGPWPVHCVQETKGAQIHPKIRKLAKHIISKGMDPKREAYSAFAGETLRPKAYLEDILKENHIRRVLVGGLALDVCVGYTALDASALGYHTIVLIDASRAVDPAEEAKMLNIFKPAGVLVQTIT